MYACDINYMKTYSLYSFIHSFVYCRQQGPYKDMTQGNMKRKHEH